MIKTFLFSSLFSSFSKALNYYLQLDPDSVARLNKLNGKIATIEWLPLRVVFQCCFDAQGVRVQADELLSANVKISGTPWQMMNMLVTNDEQQAFFSGGITVTGETEIGQQVLALFKDLQWDGEEYLSRWVGDVPAHHAARTAKHIQTWYQHAKDSLCDNVNEYLHEEIDLFPAKEALADFFTDVDKLRMDVDRIEVKTNQLIHQCNEIMGMGSS